jgi:hypothetical protein
MEEIKKNNSITETENQNTESEDRNSKLNALLFDSDNDEVAKETPEESAMFEAFMAEYRTLMTKNNKENHSERSHQEEGDDSENEYLLSLPKKKKQKSARKIEENITVTKREDWDDEITLTPEEYEDPAAENSIMYDEIPEEEEAIPDFNLGENEAGDEDKFQLSIDFDGERTSARQEEVEHVNKYNPDKPRIIDFIYDFAVGKINVITIFLYNAGT